MRNKKKKKELYFFASICFLQALVKEIREILTIDICHGLQERK